MSKNKGQVSLAGAAQAANEEKKRVSPWKWIGIGVGLVALLVTGILLFDVVDTEEKPALTAREMAEYTYTADDIAGDVAYYLLGVTGENIGDPMDMLAVMCHDRKAGSVSVVQIPVATYIDKNNGFAVDTIGDIWYNPQPEIFCSACRVRVPAEERDGKVHATCGADLEERTGSAWLDLVRVINTQYGLPIDNYLILPRAGLAELIEALGGVEVELAKKATLAGESYSAGVHTLMGDAAVEYAVTYNYKNTPASDRERMSRQRQVLAALWQKIAACKMEDLYYLDQYGATKGILGKLMTGANPLRFNTTSFGKARLLNISEEAAADMKLSDAISRFAVQMGQVPLDRVTFSILPGAAEKNGTVSVYSVNREQVIALLNEQMNAYGLYIDEDTVTAPQLNQDPKEADLSTVTLDTVLPVTEEPEEGEE